MSSNEQSYQENLKPTKKNISFNEACQCYLTEAEIRVVTFINGGFSSKEIASKLGNSPSTILTHRRNIKKKLNLKGYRSLEKWCRNHRSEIREYSL
ncbi:helix-turn-helix transcriptional regulator [Rhodohalobacter sp.]|uniref:helix-turn-helix transcriptional regulator n=1 Tax=Rhodohalobacter sp. TaxID=1974210 RepID=UPI0035667661